MSKFQIDLNNYPSLQKLFEHDTKAFAELMKPTLDDLNRRLAAGHVQTAKQVFQREYPEFQKEVMDAFFDYKGIADQHHNEAEADSMKVLQNELNPLTIFTGGTKVYDTAGNLTTPEDYTGMEKFDVKNYIQSLLYGGRFVHIAELAKYLLLDQYELVEVLQARNFEQLSRIQPALRYQEATGIQVGTLIPDTGVFDLGDYPEEGVCPACGEELNESPDYFSFCPECKGGVKK